MSRTVINVGAVIEASRQIESAKTGVSSAKSSFTYVKNNVDTRIQNRANIRARLNDVSNRLSSIESKIERIKSTAVSSANQYRLTDAKVNQWQTDLRDRLNTGRVVSGASALAAEFKDIADVSKISSSEQGTMSPWTMFDTEKEKSEDIYGKNSVRAFVAKYDSEHTEQYFGKAEASTADSLKSSVKFKDTEDAIEDKLEEKGYLKKDDKTKYYKDGEEIYTKDAPTFYKKQATVLENKKTASASASIYDGKYDVGDNGELSVVVGEAEAHASISGGFYVIGANGEKKFSPGVSAEIGASATALEIEWEQQWLGDENLGLNSDVTVTAGKASAKANVGAQVFGSDGKLDLQLGASASAEAIGGEIEGSVGVNVLGGEVGVKGSVNYGIGAHADVGYRDGVFKCDVGASLGVGVSLGFEVDAGGMVDTVSDAASAVWDGAKDGWNNFWSMF